MGSTRLTLIPLIACLVWSYCATASEHARVVNTVKARGDQSAYLYEAQILYRNWHGLNDPPVVQPRNRMPVYPAFLAAFYNPAWTDWEFFEVAKVATIYLSIGLLAVIGLVLIQTLPFVPAMNALSILAFGVFIFKAGYTQSELLFYTLHFLTFVACWRMFLAGSPGRAIAYGAGAGGIAAVAHLTKAAMLPFVGLAMVVGLGGALASLLQREGISRVVLRMVGSVVMIAVFVAVLWPYLATSKRVHGQYFYNVNTAVLVWYDGYAQAAVALTTYGPNGWPPGPPSNRPGPLRYWREHTISQIAARLGAGLQNMAAVLYRDYWFSKFLLMQLIALAVVVATRREMVAPLLRRHAVLVVFLITYAAVFIPAIAFYAPTSGTGTGRFLLAHVAPLLFALSALLSCPTLDSLQWNVAGVPLGLRHFHGLVGVTVALDIVFVIHHRVMTTYGGF